MALDVRTLIDPMLAAIKPVVGKGWSDVRDYAEGEAEKMALTLAKITDLRTSGKIDEQQAQALLEMQKHSMRMVLLTVEGIGLITAQNAINAALGAVRTVVNSSIGFGLL
jgi:predicted deacylase